MTDEMAGIILNGTARSLRAGETVADLVAEVSGRMVAADGRAVDGGRLGVAVARNSAVVPRGQWGASALEPGDQIEILTAVQGG